ncbi:hypothetical protein PR003_g24656, partial [Phytophthora rubi]
VPDSPPCGPSATEQPDPASPASVEHTTERAVPETTHSETAGTLTAAQLPDIPGSIPFDEFDSENFLDALRRDQLFAPTDGDDLNIGRDDWLLALDSEEEGDKDSILLDEVSEEEGKSDAEVDEDADLSDDDAEDEHSQDEVPVAVCSAYAGAGVRSFETSYVCASCSRTKKGRVTLCNKARRLEHGSSLTCNEVWHQSWKNGTAIPAALQDKIRFVNKRRPGAVRETDEE